MQKATTIVIFLLLSAKALSQDLSIYSFVRTPKLVDYQFGNAAPNLTQAVSIGFGMIHKKKFLELGTFLTEGDVHGYYTFFGLNIQKVEVANTIGINTNWFSEITNVPIQQENNDSAWIYTTGLCLFPNKQFQRFNIGIPLCLGLAYDEEDLYLNSRFIINLAYTLR